MKKTKITWNLIACVILLATLVIVYVANSKMHFEMDDVWYSTNLVTGEKLENVQDIIESQIWHFKQWGGRSMAHGILQLTLLSGEKMADVINTTCFFLLGMIICLIARTRNLWHYILCCGFMVVLNANWSQTLLWQSGVANYLYMTIVILLFLWCYFDPLEQEQKKNRFGITFWIIPLGLIAGWSNENMGPAVTIGTVLVSIYLYWKEKKCYPYMILGSISAFLGSIPVIFAPGNFIRGDEAAALVQGKGLLWQAFLRGFSIANGLFYYLLDGVILLLILILVSCYLLKQRLVVVDWLLLLMGILSYGAMILSPHYPDRASFGTMILLLCVIMRLFVRILQQKEELELPARGVAFFVWLGGMFPLCTYICQMLGWIK